MEDEGRRLHPISTRSRRASRRGRIDVPGALGGRGVRVRVLTGCILLTYGSIGNMDFVTLITTAIMIMIRCRTLAEDVTRSPSRHHRRTTCPCLRLGRTTTTGWTTWTLWKKPSGSMRSAQRVTQMLSNLELRVWVPRDTQVAGKAGEAHGARCT